ncbi:anion permease [Halanaerobium sp. Z-7514]|uniref:Sodium-dependent dicarboxylate transporter SdcS n=1 Tax=Halanaerobium polyolivorans TaxID=2886943 RepID=A0AAW4WYL3_9FIRM|nr:SLC13 family permease [Halanaerobium polyolivorans]MCC3144195.1 anion permease [Halanaerobium polyolivorans]
MKKFKKEISFFVAIFLAIIVWNLEIATLPAAGQKTLALSLMTVLFWATKVAHPGYVSALFLSLLLIFEIAPPTEVFSLWTSSLIYIIIGAYLIAAAVKSSGLGERIAYNFILNFVNSYKSIIYSIFILTLFLSLLIPHPWPRSFLIMSVMAVVIESAGLSDDDAAKVGLAVFAFSVPISMIFLTGDSTINILAVEMSGQTLSWLGWLYHMGVPAALASILTLILFLNLFKAEKEVSINKAKIEEKLSDLGSLSNKEKRMIFWITTAIILWTTDSLHGIDLGWVTLLIAVLMGMPVVGNVLEAKDWQNVPIGILFFLTAAVSIGRIGSSTGMNAWIASVILPAEIPANMLLFALMVALISITLHMFLGSVIAVMGIAIPSFIIFAEGYGINPLVPALMAYSSIALHYVFPFHHLNILVGLGKHNGLYDDKKVIKLGIPLTIIIIIVVVFEAIWWQITGLL